MAGRARSLLCTTSAVALCLAAVTVACQLPGPRFDVNTTADVVDRAPGDGVCEATLGAGDCSVRAAVMEANAEPGPADIELGDANTYVLTRAGRDEDGSVVGDLDVLDHVSINGRSTIDGGGLDRVIDLHAGTVFIDGVTIRNGDPAAGGGGGILVADGASLVLTRTTVTGNRAPVGGAIDNEGTTQVFDSRLADNHAVPPPGQGQFFPVMGAAVFTSGALTLTRSVVTGNTSPTGYISGGAAIQAGGPLAMVDIERSTLSHDDVELFSEPNTQGNIVRNSTLSGGTLVSAGAFQINSSTLVGDTDERMFGPLVVATVASSAMQNLIGVCRSPRGPIPAAQITSGGYNMVSDSTCGLRGSGDRQGVNLLLGPLADHGGPTPTYLPFANSPLVDAIPPSDNCDPFGTDQRGRPRLAGAACDVGSVEGAAAQSALPLHLVVTNPGPTQDSSPGNGVCDAGPGGCTLAAAIQETNAWPAADVVTIGPGVSPINGSISVIDDLTLHGNGSTIAGSVEHRHGAFALDRVTVDPPDAHGSHVTVVSSEGLGSIRIVDSTIIGNPSSDAYVTDGSIGVFASDLATIESSTIMGNGRSAIVAENDALIINSTITNNGPPFNTMFLIVAGHLGTIPANSPPVTLTIVSSSVVDNAGPEEIVAGDDAQVRIGASIVGSDENNGIACNFERFRFTSLGYNLMDDDSCSFRNVGDQLGLPNVGPLADNGGPTETRLPLTNSAAVNRIPVGTPFLCENGLVDQRHVARPVGPSCDVGAVEGTSPVP